jgi:CarboxypepD_reg-like domain
MSMRLTSRRRTTSALSVALALECAALSALAQPPVSGIRISGTVSDKGSHTAIPLADILFVTEGRIATSDSAGRYSFAGLPPGEAHFVVRSRHYPTTEVIVELKSGDDLVLPIELDSTRSARMAQLPAVAVTARVAMLNYRLVDFERRRHTGAGQYLTDDEIRSSGAANLTDATRNMRGMTTHCGGNAEVTGCRIHMVRAPNNCPPEYIVDGRVDNVFGPMTPIRDIIALEVYLGASDVPGEFAGARAGCGTIVIWTLSGPPRRKP